MRYTLGITAAALTCLNACRAGRDARAPSDFHDRAVRVMRQLADREVKGTDTLVTLAPEPTLFHTAVYADSVFRAGLVRGDAMVGTAEVRWSSGAPAAFEVIWTSSVSPPMIVRGARQAAAIKISGSRDTTLRVPELPWAVADYGMETLLVPLLDSAPAQRRLVVLRPFALKWDTLDVSTERSGDAIVARVRGSGTPVVMVIANHRLIWLRQPQTKAEVRPLDGTAAFAEYTRLKAALGDVK